jgi:hypothetical protein
MIVKAECFEEQPVDRDYNKNGKERETQIEILGDGLLYCIRADHICGLLIWEE